MSNKSKDFWKFCWTGGVNTIVVSSSEEKNCPYMINNKYVKNCYYPNEYNNVKKLIREGETNENVKMQM